MVYVCTYINKFNFKIVDGKFNKNRSLFFVKPIKFRNDALLVSVYVSV